MFHQWISGDEDTCSCLICSLTVSNGYLFREDPKHRVTIGISVILPTCPGPDASETHYVDSEGCCHYCNQETEEMDSVECPAHPANLND